MQASQSLESAPIFAGSPVPDLRREFLNLAEPIIADRIIEAYDGLGGEIGDTRPLSMQHRRLWRAILLRNKDMMVSLTGELRDALEAAGLSSGAADAIDQTVLEELVDITVKCFRSSNDKSKNCSLILLDAASFIGSARGHA